MASSSCRIRNQYLSKLGILPAGTTTTTPTRKPKLLHHLHRDGGRSGKPSLLPEEEPSTAMWKKRCRLSSEDTDETERTSTTVASSSCSTLPEEEILEVSLRGLAFVESAASMASLSCFDDSFRESGASLPSFYDGDDEEEVLVGEDLEELLLQESMSSLPPHCYPEDVAHTTKKTLQVQFHSAVAVIEIPSHRDYDKSARKNLWQTMDEQEENARRNSIEYWADGGDWRNATEEENMVRTRKGKLVHPATWRLVREQQQQQQEQQRKTRLKTKALLSKHHVKYERRRRLAAFINRGTAPSLTRFADT